MFSEFRKSLAIAQGVLTISGLVFVLLFLTFWMNPNPLISVLAIALASGFLFPWTYVCVHWGGPLGP
jgi:hypothetical protein